MYRSCNVFHSIIVIVNKSVSVGSAYMGPKINELISIRVQNYSINKSIYCLLWTKIIISKPDERLSDSGGIF